MEQRAGPPRNDRFKLNKEAVLTYPLKRIVMEGKHEHIRTKSKQHGIYFFNDPFRNPSHPGNRTNWQSAYLPYLIRLKTISEQTNLNLSKPLFIENTQ